MTDLVFSPSLSVSQGRPVVSSLTVADHFGKRHANVIRDIRRVASEVSETFSQLNFEFSEYIDETGRSLPMCELSKDGFTIVVMGYTGKEAMTRKEAYITRFNEMEAALLNGTHGEPVSIPLTPSTADDRKPLRSLVFAWSKAAGVHVDTCWPQVKAHFQLTRIDDLPKEWIPDALAFVQGKIDAIPKALPEPPKTKALLPAHELSYHDRCAEAVASMMALRGEFFRASDKMADVFRRPFWSGQDMPEDKKAFATAMNYAIQSFYLSVNKDLEAMELMFKAYVEGEKILYR